MFGEKEKAMKKSVTVTKVYCDECGKEFASNDEKRFMKLSSGFIGSEASMVIQFATSKRQVTTEDPVTICENCALNLLNGAIKAIEVLRDGPQEDEDSEDD
jgi:hypothetical protein